MGEGDVTLLTENIYTVSEISEAIRQSLETEFPQATVIGEVANFKAHTSGHFYFSLRDEKNLLRVVIFRRDALAIGFGIENGMMILVSGRVSHYGGGGQTQLIGRRVEPAGRGKLEIEFRRLLKKLMDEGLTDPREKREIPKYPQKIGVITSPTGAAIKDITDTLLRRWPIANVVHFGVGVQGSMAVSSIIEALAEANDIEDMDVIILARGGGSIEDLWVFNNEKLARAIRSSIHPVITGIGHEIDTTIADYVSDMRAATPTAAAEIATPLKKDIEIHIKGVLDKLAKATRRSSEHRISSLNYLIRSSVFPAIVHRLENSELRLDDRVSKINRMWERSRDDKLSRIINSNFHISRTLERKTRAYQYQLVAILEKLSVRNPRSRIDATREKIKRMVKLVALRVKGSIVIKKRDLSGAIRTLRDIYPFKVLERGYTFCTNKQGDILGRVVEVSKGDDILVNFYDGVADCSVEEKRERKDDEKDQF
jgi:exodeoxyribonuclease VII large subunit